MLTVADAIRAIRRTNNFSNVMEDYSIDPSTLPEPEYPLSLTPDENPFADILEKGDDADMLFLPDKFKR